MIFAVSVPGRHESASAKPGPPNEPPKPVPPPPPRWHRWLLPVATVVTLGLLAWLYLLGGPAAESMSYSGFRDQGWRRPGQRGRRLPA